MRYKLGFIGAGNMAEAIARAAIHHRVLAAADIIAADPSEDRRAVFAELGADVSDSNADVIAHSVQVLLAVKPQRVAQVAADLAAHGRDDQVVVSIMAGVRTAKLADAAGRPLRVVRVMPNTPMMAGYGMAGVCRGEYARDHDDDLAMRLFSAGQSQAIGVDERDLDAITAVSGSGPAYVFYLAEAMEKAAQDLGLGDHARLLVTQTILGAAELLVQSDDSAAELRRKVTSPGGTTEAAIEHMDRRGMKDIIVGALEAAQRRSRELGA